MDPKARPSFKQLFDEFMAMSKEEDINPDYIMIHRQGNSSSTVSRSDLSTSTKSSPAPRRYVVPPMDEATKVKLEKIRKMKMERNIDFIKSMIDEFINKDSEIIEEACQILRSYSLLPDHKKEVGEKAVIPKLLLILKSYPTHSAINACVIGILWGLAFDEPCEKQIAASEAIQLVVKIAKGPLANDAKVFAECLAFFWSYSTKGTEAAQKLLTEGVFEILLETLEKKVATVPVQEYCVACLANYLEWKQHQNYNQWLTQVKSKQQWIENSPIKESSVFSLHLDDVRQLLGLPRLVKIDTSQDTEQELENLLKKLPGNKT